MYVHIFCSLSLPLSFCLSQFSNREYLWLKLETWRLRCRNHQTIIWNEKKQTRNLESRRVEERAKKMNELKISNRKDYRLCLKNILKESNQRIDGIECTLCIRINGSLERKTNNNNNNNNTNNSTVCCYAFNKDAMSVAYFPKAWAHRDCTCERCTLDPYHGARAPKNSIVHRSMSSTPSWNSDTPKNMTHSRSLFPFFYL